MNKDGLTIEETALIPPINIKKKSRNTTNNQLLQQVNNSQYQQQLTEQTEHLDLTDESKVIIFVSSIFKYSDIFSIK
jgi:hypothetical protein